MIRIDRLAKNASGWVEEVDLLTRVLKRIVVRSVCLVCVFERTKETACKLKSNKSTVLGVNTY